MTTIINVLGFNKDALVAWAKREGERADQISKEACDLGSYIHAVLEAHVYGTIPDREITKSASMEAVVLGDEARRRFDMFLKSNNANILESEYIIINDESMWGGTTDGIIQMGDGKKYVFDFKTAKGIFRDHIIQLAAYIEGVKIMSHYPPEIKDKIIQNNKTNKHTKDMSIHNYSDIENGGVLFHINKNPTIENVLKPCIIPNDIISMGINDWHHALELYSSRLIMNKFLKEINK